VGVEKVPERESGRGRSQEWVCRIVGRRDMVKAEGGGEMDQPIGSGWYVKEPRAA
jgi:hypothetical protein